MAGDETPHGGRRGMLAGLLAPLRLPERVIDALDSLVEATRALSPMHTELTRVREQTEPLAKLLPALERLEERVEHLEERIDTRLDSLHELVGALEGQDSYLNKTVGDLSEEVSAMHKTLSGLQDDVQGVTHRLPDPNRGPLQKAHDVLTSGDANPSS